MKKSNILYIISIYITILIALCAFIQSFNNLRLLFGTPIVPISIDGAILAIILIRIVAAINSWRIPGTLILIWGLVGMTSYLNIQFEHDLYAKFGNGIVPFVYTILIEIVIYMMKLKYSIINNGKAKIIPFSFWIATPIFSYRAFIYLLLHNDKNITINDAFQYSDMYTKLKGLLKLTVPKSKYIHKLVLRSVKYDTLSFKDIYSIIKSGKNDQEVTYSIIQLCATKTSNNNINMILDDNTSAVATIEEGRKKNENTEHIIDIAHNESENIIHNKQDNNIVKSAGNKQNIDNKEKNETKYDIDEDDTLDRNYNNTYDMTVSNIYDRYPDLKKVAFRDLNIDIIRDICHLNKDESRLIYNLIELDQM